MRVYDASSADAKRLNLDKIKDATGKTHLVPYMVFATKDGTVIGSYPLPLTREGVREKLPKIKVKIGELDTVPSYIVSTPNTYQSIPVQNPYVFTSPVQNCVNGVCYPDTRMIPPNLRRK